MKVLYAIYDHIHNPWLSGGGAVRCHELNRRLVDLGHSVTVITGGYPGAGDKTIDGVRYIFMKARKTYMMSTFCFAFHASVYITDHSQEYDVVVEDFAPWNPLFSRFGSLAPTVLHVNHREGINIIKRWHIPGVMFYLIECVYPRLYDIITVPSEGTRDKIGARNITVVPTGISEDILNKGLASEAEEEGFVLYLGRLHIYNKGLDTLMAAAKILKDTRFVLAGKGPDEQELRRMCKGMTNVEFAGFVDDDKKIDLIKKSSVLVLPSRYEGWGIVLLEAAACGRPVIVSSIPEVSFAVKAGFGEGFKTGDGRSLADAAKGVLSDKQKRSDMARAGRALASQYTWERIVDGYENVLIEAAKRKAG